MARATATSAGRIAPISPQLEAILRKVKETSGLQVCRVLQRQGNQEREDRVPRRMPALALTKVTPHTLRHTAAAWMVQKGVPMAKVAKMLGDSEKTVERVYSHHAPEFLQDAAAALQLDMGEA